jgi:hypothetical protein
VLQPPEQAANLLEDTALPVSDVLVSHSTRLSAASAIHSRKQCFLHVYLLKQPEAPPPALPLPLPLSSPWSGLMCGAAQGNCLSRPGLSQRPDLESYCLQTVPSLTALIASIQHSVVGAPLNSTRWSLASLAGGFQQSFCMAARA